MRSMAGVLNFARYGSLRGLGSGWSANHTDFVPRKDSLAHSAPVHYTENCNSHTFPACKRDMLSLFTQYSSTGATVFFYYCELNGELFRVGSNDRCISTKHNVERG
jgi:hypothetical protein